MKKNTRTLIILGVVLVICIGAYIGVSLYTKQQASISSGEIESTVLYAVGRSAPVSISYENEGKTLAFELENDKWVVADNVDFPLKQSSLTQIASALTGLSAIRSLDMTMPLSTYGLDNPAMTLTAADSAGNAFKLLIGSQNSDYYYAMTEGGNQIYTIASTLVGYLNTDIMSMIILDTLPSLSETTMDTIRLGDGAASLTLDKHKNKDGSYTWFVIEGTTYTSADEVVLPPGAERSPEKYISNAVTGLGSARFTSCAAFRPTADDLKAYGLDVPQITVTVDYTTTTGAGTLDQKTTKGTASLEIGGALDDGSGFYARVPGSQEVNVLPNDAVAPLLDALTAMGFSG